MRIPEQVRCDCCDVDIKPSSVGEPRTVGVMLGARLLANTRGAVDLCDKCVGRLETDAAGWLDKLPAPFKGE